MFLMFLLFEVFGQTLPQTASLVKIKRTVSHRATVPCGGRFFGTGVTFITPSPGTGQIVIGAASFHTCGSVFFQGVSTSNVAISSPAAVERGVKFLQGDERRPTLLCHRFEQFLSGTFNSSNLLTTSRESRGMHS